MSAINTGRAMDEKIVDFARKNGIELTTWCFKPPLIAFYMHEANYPPIIGFHPALLEDIRKFRSVFAEELGHHFTTAGNTLPFKHLRYSDRLKISQAEYRAMKWGALFLMPLDKLIMTVESGLKEVWELAEQFVVTEDFVRFRIGLDDCQLYLYNRRQTVLQFIAASTDCD